MNVGMRVLAGLLVLAGGSLCVAQELEPRAYSASPVGTNFCAVVGGKSQGAVLFDAAVPITDAEADINFVSVGYGRTFAVGRRQGLLTVAVPYSWGTVEGMVFEESQSVRRSGLADMRVRTSVNLVGPEAMSVEEFQKAPRKTIFGVSLTVQAPIGEYDRTKLINLGTNRWSFKPEVGLSVPVGRWYLDVYGGAWFYQTNDEFYPGDATRRQDPIAVVQVHASYTFANRAWLALDGTWFGGGVATVDSNPPSTRQDSSRFGGTLSVPIRKGQSLKVAVNTGASTRTGTDFDSVLVGWQLTWFDGPP